MEITVNVDEATLADVIHEARDDYGHDVTLGSEVARRLANHVIHDRETWPPFRDRVLQIRDEEIREQVRPLIAEALAKSLQQTNNFGEPTGQTTTLSEVIVAEAKRVMTQKAGDSYNRSNRTILQDMVAKEVQAALAKEIADAVKQARAEVASQIGGMVAAAVEQGMRQR